MKFYEIESKTAKIERVCLGDFMYDRLGGYGIVRWVKRARSTGTAVGTVHSHEGKFDLLEDLYTELSDQASERELLQEERV